MSPKDRELLSKCENKVLTLYLDKGPISYVDISSWKEKGRFDAQFIQSENFYCSYCYNAIKDGDEEGLDCGGSCNKCEIEKGFSLNFLVVPLWIGVLLLLALLFLRNKNLIIK